MLVLSGGDALHGGVPAALGACGRLRTLDLCGCAELHGALPEELARCRELVTLDVRGTNITDLPLDLPPRICVLTGAAPRYALGGNRPLETKSGRSTVW